MQVLKRIVAMNKWNILLKDHFVKHTIITIIYNYYH